MYEERYREYPDFCAHLQELERQRQARVAEHLARYQSLPHTEALSQEQTTGLALLDAEFQQQAAQAHHAFGVPVLLPWEAALHRTGGAVYHDGRLSLAHVRKRSATLTRETERITLEVREVLFFPLDNNGIAKYLDSTLLLLYRDLLQPMWEAREEAAAALNPATIRLLWAQMKAFYSLEQTLMAQFGPQPASVQALADEQAHALRAELGHLANILPMALIFFQDLYERPTGCARQIKDIQDWLRELDWHRQSCLDALQLSSKADAGDLGALMAQLRGLLVALKPLEALVVDGSAQNDSTKE